MIGTSLALIGAFFGALVGLYIRQISNYAKMHFLMSPMAFVLGNVILCPIFLAFKLINVPIDPTSHVITEQGTMGTQLHVYSWQDVITLFSLALMIYFQQIFMTLAFTYEKAGRVAPVNYLQIILCCLADIMIFGTKLSSN